MALEVEWSDTAKLQLDNIINYLEENWTQREIRNFFKSLEKGIETISKAPKQHKSSLRKEGTFEFQLSSHITLFYTFDKQKVNILLLWSNRMDPKKLQ
jgi:plasmid stabilization system protein ParE